MCIFEAAKKMSKAQAQQLQEILEEKLKQSDEDLLAELLAQRLVYRGRVERLNKRIKKLKNKLHMRRKRSEDTD